MVESRLFTVRSWGARSRALRQATWGLTSMPVWSDEVRNSTAHTMARIALAVTSGVAFQDCLVFQGLFLSRRREVDWTR